ncbi:selenocysteine-specific translation elongation factor [Streptomyces poriferorum]|uniref:Selenocysteine-specific translation elongation factor n=1 Tax=Streptomyces poriferorum TaxID=2798799 RepID=A0ABY9J2U0_9ACTN|nr:MULTISPECIES: selenocysteine-specific translation elongation factor [unclassified Streptomyces]MDP5310193.1 selenocysteine-specific translation elongation factor [Streptomyces sp. Alt4]WLQ60644.1 selenocysteine-specific translation elongation factor [Streptomyces sp. Alt2]
MRVIATAGHVDHGKSTLIHALTGTHPDRLAEERRRGLTIDLGFAWTDLPSGERLAFVDVPGHERFVPTMLAGVGPVPAVLFVVAADEGWKPQSAEHLAAVNALGVRHGLLVITRCDMADPGPATAQAQDRIRSSTLGSVEAVAVSARTGAGIAELRAALDRLVARLPDGDAESMVRLWIDRSFTVRGSGLVVTGTLGAGRIRRGDVLVTARSGSPVRVRGLQALGEETALVRATARVAVNLRGLEKESTGRGDALLTPGSFLPCLSCDVRVHGGTPATELPRTAVAHIGSAAVPVRVRSLGPDLVRLTLPEPLPLRIGDRAVLRDPGLRRVLAGLTVLDPQPPELRRRGAAARRAAELGDAHGVPAEAAELRRRLLVRRGQLTAMGVAVHTAPVVGDWLADPAHWTTLRARLAELVAAYLSERPTEDGIPVEAARHRLGLPAVSLVEALVTPPLRMSRGRVTAGPTTQPAPVADAVRRLIAELDGRPFAAPNAQRLLELGFGRRELAAAVRHGAVLRLAEHVVLLPDAPRLAADRLSELDQPFTVGTASRALDTSRRVTVPLLEHCDGQGITQVLPDKRRRCTHQRRSA